jgi:hypothetical protein
VTNLAASVVLVVVPLRYEESGRMPKKFPEGLSEMASSVPSDSDSSRKGTKAQITSINFAASSNRLDSEKHPIAQNASSFAYKR